MANLVAPGTRAVVGRQRLLRRALAEMPEPVRRRRRRVEGRVGARDRSPARSPRRSRRAAPTSSRSSTPRRPPGVQNPVPAIAAAARAHDALVLADAVTSLGGMPVDVPAWDVDACYSGSQKCLGAPSGLAPIVFTPRALARRVTCRSFYLDLRCSRTTGSAASTTTRSRRRSSTRCARRSPIVEEEGLEARWARHERHHPVLTAGLEAMGLPLYPPAGERLWTLHTRRVPDGLDEAAVRTRSARAVQSSRSARGWARSPARSGASA